VRRLLECGAAELRGAGRRVDACVYTNDWVFARSPLFPVVCAQYGGSRTGLLLWILQHVKGSLAVFFFLPRMFNRLWEELRGAE